MALGHQLGPGACSAGGHRGHGLAPAPGWPWKLGPTGGEKASVDLQAEPEGSLSVRDLGGGGCHRTRPPFCTGPGGPCLYHLGTCSTRCPRATSVSSLCGGGCIRGSAAQASHRPRCRVGILARAPSPGPPLFRAVGRLLGAHALRTRTPGGASVGDGGL